MLKKLIYKLVDLYLWPLNSNWSLALFAKYRILWDKENLLAAVDMITKQRAEKPPVDEIIIDVGAFDGGTSIFFSKHFSHARVFGFEPNPEPFARSISRTSSFSK